MRIEDVSKAIENKTIVSFKEYSFYISGVITRYSKKRGWYYEIELHDLKANSISIAPIEDVKVIKPL